MFALVQVVRHIAPAGSAVAVAGVHGSVYRAGMARRPRKHKAAWDAGSVRNLRAHLELTQQQLAEELGVRQQTVSEWETGVYRPRGASERVLTFVAERAGFEYGAEEP